MITGVSRLLGKEEHGENERVDKEGESERVERGGERGDTKGKDI